MELVKVREKQRKRIGRGLSSGQGKTAGRGTKGQKSRSGFNLPNRYAGGESSLSLRLPKLPGFKSHKKKAIVISFDDISKSYKNGEVVSLESLLAKGLISKGRKAKILSNGKLNVSITIAKDVRVSESAQKILISAEKESALKAEKSAEKAEETKEAVKKPAVKKAPAKKKTE